jgi:hypothetical protein
VEGVEFEVGNATVLTAHALAGEDNPEADKEVPWIPSRTAD